MVKDMGIAILTLPDGRVQLLHTFSNVSCHIAVFVKARGLSQCVRVPKWGQNNSFVTYIWYVVGSESFWPDQLFKVTEIKQLCYFST